MYKLTSRRMYLNTGKGGLMKIAHKVGYIIPSVGHRSSMGGHRIINVGHKTQLWTTKTQLQDTWASSSHRCPRLLILTVSHIIPLFGRKPHHSASESKIVVQNTNGGPENSDQRAINPLRWTKNSNSFKNSNGGF